MTLQDSIIEMMINQWFGYIDSYGYLKLIKLIDSKIHMDNGLEFYIVNLSLIDPEPELDGYYHVIEIKDILNFAPVNELKLSNKILSLIAKDLLGN